ncbi:MAG: hypothetical protein NTW28_16285 [Candidatus Solibacter sp.]|nr:hypothetical protein [Candidatus Solibacter sp.]
MAEKPRGQLQVQAPREVLVERGRFYHRSHGPDGAFEIAPDIEAEDPGAYDPLAAARLMAAALRAEAPDLVLTGLQSDDLGYGQTGPILAELLGLPHATLIMEVEKLDSGIRVKRELEDGWFQHVEMPLPALLAIQSGISRLRYATLMGIKKAKTKEVKRLTPAELSGDAPVASIRLERVYLPERAKHTQLFEGNAKEAAARLVEKLRFEARVI